MKSWLAAIAIFIRGVIVVLLLIAFKAYRNVSEGHATGFGLFVSNQTLVVGALVTILLAVFAVWFSGRLIR